MSPTNPNMSPTNPNMSPTKPKHVTNQPKHVTNQTQTCHQPNPNMSPTNPNMSPTNPNMSPTKPKHVTNQTQTCHQPTQTCHQPTQTCHQPNPNMLVGRQAFPFKNGPNFHGDMNFHGAMGCKVAMPFPWGPFYGIPFLALHELAFCRRGGVHMGVSKNRGTPKSSILIGFSIINHPFWGTIIFGNTHISRSR